MRRMRVRPLWLAAPALGAVLAACTACTACSPAPADSVRRETVRGPDTAASPSAPHLKPAAPKPVLRSGGKPPLFSALDLGLLETPDRERWQRTDEILDNLKIADGSVVADIAAGGGWFSVRIARRVGPTGIVYAEEIQPTMIQAISHRIQTENLPNIRPVLGTPVDPRLPKGSLDAAIIANAFRDIEAPVPLLVNLRGALNSRGLIGVIDFAPGGGGPGPDAEERVLPEAIVAAAASAGLRLVAQYPSPPFEYLLVFGK